MSRVGRFIDGHERSSLLAGCGHYRSRDVAIASSCPSCGQHFILLSPFTVAKGHGPVYYLPSLYTFTYMKICFRDTLRLFEDRGLIFQNKTLK